MIETTPPNPANQAAAVIWTTDRELRFTSSQGAALKASGYHGEQFVGMSLFEFFQTDDPHFPPIAAHRRAIEGASASYEAETWGRRWDCHVEPLHDAAGAIVGAVGVALDATSRKQADEALRQSRQRYEDLVNSVDGIVWEAEAETVQFTFVSQQAERLLGYPVERWLTEPTFWQDHMHPDDRSWAIPFCARATAEMRPHEFEYRVIAADGRIVWLRDIVTVVVENGRPTKLRGVMVDITEKRRTEEALRESEARLRLMTDQIPAALWTTDTQMRVTSIRGALMRTMGLSPDLVVGRTVLDVIQTNDLGHPEVAPYFTALQGKSVSFEAILGGRALDVHLEPLRDGAGNIMGTIGVAFDITERKRAEEALREKEDQYRSIFEATSDGLLIRNMDGVIVEVNPAYCRMHGYRRDELIGRRVVELIHPDYRHVLKDSIEAIEAMAPYRTEAVNLRKDGTPFHVEVRGTAFTYRGEPHVLAVVRDITERRQAEEARREKEEQYRSVFETTSDGIVISDLDGRTVEVNPAFCAMHGYTPDELKELDHTAFIHPSSFHLYQGYMETIRAGREFRSQAVDIRKDGTPFHIEVHGTPFTYMGKPHALGLVRDVTERVHAHQLLEERVAERTRELSTLLQVSRNVASTLELQPLLSLILNQLKVVVDYSAAGLGVLEGDVIKTLDARLASTQEQLGDFLGQRVPVASMGEIWQANLRGEAVIIADVLDDSPLAGTLRTHLGEAQETVRHHMRSYLQVPLTLKDRVCGSLAIGHPQPGYFTPHHAELAVAFANQAAIAIENARLYEQAQEETRKTAALAQIASSVALGSGLDTALNEVARSVVEASGAVACSLTVAMDRPTRVRLLGTYGLPEGYGAAADAMIRNGGPLLSAMVYDDPSPVVIHNVREYVRSHPAYAPLHPFMSEVTWDTMVTLPSIYRGRHLARLNLYYLSGHEPRKAELEFLTAIANQAAIAIENARLFAEVQGKAALEERQRLARELHDSVSQALYGIVLGTKTARTLLDRDPHRVAGPLDYVYSLAEAGLAEMRALIFELRPESLETEGLVAALTKHTAALQARHQIEVTVALGDEPAIPVDAKEALYRIAQEALHNIVKHADARSVELGLQDEDARVVLEVRDDGIGFDPNGEFPGHLGLKSMRERAARQGGSLEVESIRGNGTIIRAWVPSRATATP